MPLPSRSWPKNARRRIGSTRRRALRPASPSAADCQRFWMTCAEPRGPASGALAASREPLARADDGVGELEARALRDLLAEARDACRAPSARPRRRPAPGRGSRRRTPSRQATAELARPQRRVRERAPVVCDDDVGRVAPQRLVDVPGRREERRPHADALRRADAAARSRRRRSRSHSGLSRSMSRPGATRSSTSCPCRAERDREERVRRPGPARARDAEDLAGDDGDPSRRHRRQRRREQRAVRARATAAAARAAGRGALRSGQPRHELGRGAEVSRQRALEVLQHAQRLGRVRSPASPAAMRSTRAGSGRRRSSRPRR